MMFKREAQGNEVAKDRLRTVLANDRGYLEGKTLEYFRRDMATTMMSFLELEEESLQVAFGRESDGTHTLRIVVPDIKIRKKPIPFM